MKKVEKELESIRILLTVVVIILIMIFLWIPLRAEPLKTWEAGLCFEGYNCSKSTATDRYSHYIDDVSSGALVNRVFYAIAHPEDYNGRLIKHYDLFKRGWSTPTQRGRMP